MFHKITNDDDTKMTKRESQYKINPLNVKRKMYNYKIFIKLN